MNRMTAPVSPSPRVGSPGSVPAASGAGVVTVLAVDPGPVQSGWCVVRQDRGGYLISRSQVSANAIIAAFVESWLRRDMVIAIEMIQSYGMPVGREVFDTCVWIGRFQQASRDPDAVRLIPRRDVKLHLCGSARAKDANVWQALVDRFGPPGTKAAPGLLYPLRSHTRAAFALAVTVLDTLAPVPG